MFLLDLAAGAGALAPVPFLVATATRYSRRNRPAEQDAAANRRGDCESGGECLRDPDREGVRA